MWKFVHNGQAWWLRIESGDQLLDYLRATDEERYGRSTLRVAKRVRDGLDDRDKHGCYPMADAIEILWKNSDMNLFEMVGQLMMMGHNTYFKLLDQHGFININHVGGCNSFSWEPVATEFREKLVFPHYTIDDIRVKTWELEEKKRGIKRPYDYRYHWYAYLGDVQLKNGDVEKWNTRDEAYEFARSIVERKKS